LSSTFVYVSSAEDGDIGLYTLRADGSLEPRERYKAGKAVMPMAVRPDKRLLVAALRAQPYSACSYGIDRASGALRQVSSGPLAESLPYISFDRSGRWLFGASYGAGLVSLNELAPDGRVLEPRQVIPTARNAHSIRIDHTNRFVFVPHLGTDQVFQFVFDAAAGRLAANTPPVLQLGQGSGPRHIIVAPDNRFLYLLNELTAAVTTLALDASSGQLREVANALALPPDSRLRPGAPRGPAQPPRDVSNDIWASDLHLTPDGRFLYAAERTSSTLAAFSVNGQTGELKYLGSTPTEAQPRGFAIDPGGRFLVACGEKSSTISSYAIDQQTGALRPLGKFPTGKGSNWVEIVGFD
jgi:6-phosphogluconolactonase